jgi:hypothetical protein
MDPVVFLFHDWGFACTGTVVAPRVVVSAKHCLPAGAPPDGWHVMVGPGWHGFTDEYGVVETRTPPGDGYDEGDIGVLLLDRDFTQGRIRWAFVPWPGFALRSTVTSIGYGQSVPGDDSSSGVKYRRDGYVSSFGRLSYATTDNRVCSGDSGGPSLFEGVLVGVASAALVGDDDFARQLADFEARIHRLVHGDDLVTKVPPEDLGFRHVGREVKLESPPARNWLQKIADWFRPPKALADHAPVNYVDKA